MGWFIDTLNVITDYKKPGLCNIKGSIVRKIYKIGANKIYPEILTLPHFEYLFAHSTMEYMNH